jgi:alpha-glucoside transport system substrate-binding protein
LFSTIRDVEAAKLQQAAEKNFSKDWRGYGIVNSTFCAAPLDSTVKSFVWYSPKTFREKRYAVPKSWDEMIALSDRNLAS